MDNKIYVSLPGFHNNLELNLLLIDLWKEHPEYFYDGVIIDSVYDCFPCKWTAGRGMASWECKYKDDNELEEILTSILDRGVKIRYNFTNSLLTEEHVYDKISNEILTKTLAITKRYNLPLGITIASDALKEYLIKNYSDFYLIWSTTLGQIGIDEINKKTENEILVLDYMYNNDFKFIGQLTHPENIEILANEHCQLNCPYRDKHWKWISEVQLAYPEEPCRTPTGCLNSRVMNKLTSTRDPSINAKVVTAYDLKNMYFPYGINKLKLCGRQEFIEPLIYDFVRMLIKPFYQDEISRMLIDKVGYRYTPEAELNYFNERSLKLFGHPYFIENDSGFSEKQKNEYTK